MASLLEYVGSVHIYLGPYRGNPIALYLKRNGDRCVISPKVYPWNGVIGVGETPNKAAADFEDKWKAKGLSPEMYTGPSWEGGIKPERPKPAPPPKPAGPSAPAASAHPSGGQDGAQSNQSPPAHATHPTPDTARPTAGPPPETRDTPEASASTNSSDEKSQSPQQH